ncbi:MAG: hypothetical protein JSW03_00305, partial [Candidatus Eiseniibacteriota bacterium]
MKRPKATKLTLLAVFVSILLGLPLRGGASLGPVPPGLGVDGEPRAASPLLPTLERRGDVYVASEIQVEGERLSLPFSVLLEERLAKRTPATFSDPFRAALWTIPGVTPRDELFVRPSLHGGLPDWVSVYYGDFPDCYPYMLYGALSVANSQFDELRLLKGAFPVEYGDALAGVVVIEPRGRDATGSGGRRGVVMLIRRDHRHGPIKERN